MNNKTESIYTKLTTIGGYAYTGNILVAHSKDGTYIALSKVCTHEGSTVQYLANTNNIYCPNHGATFNTAGAVTQGPAGRALTQYKVTLSADGKSLLELNTMFNTHDNLQKSRCLDSVFAESGRKTGVTYLKIDTSQRTK